MEYKNGIDDHRKTAGFPLGPFQIRLVHGVYGLFLCIIIFLGMLKGYPNLAWEVSLVISVLHSGLFAAYTYRTVEKLFYKFILNKISFIGTLKKALVSKLGGENDEMVEGLTILKNASIVPRYVPPYLKPEIEKIAKTLKEAYYLPNGGWDRKFNINYSEFSFRQARIWHYMAAAIQYMPIDVVAEAIKNIVEFQKRKPYAMHLSARDIYSNIFETYRGKDAKAIVTYHEKLGQNTSLELPEFLRKKDREDYLKWINGKQTEVKIDFDQSILDELSIQDHKQYSEIVFSMKTSAYQIATEIITSETHIVLSAAFKLENGRNIVVISATNTDKNNLLVYSQTPIVWKNGEGLKYFCDPSHRPSSEILAHWVLHEKLKDRYSCLVHSHAVDILDYVKLSDTDGFRNLILPEGEIKTISWESQGTEQFGEHIYQGIKESELPATVVEDHGIWIAGESFDAGTNLMAKVSDFAAREIEL